MHSYWKPIRDRFLENQGEGEKYLAEVLDIIIGDETQFALFFQKVLEAELYQLGEGYFVHLPKALIDDHEYQGDVEIYWNNFDCQEHAGAIRLDKFCFYVKLAALVHSQCVSSCFEPWEKFSELDIMQNRYLGVRCEKS